MQIPPGFGSLLRLYRMRYRQRLGLDLHSDPTPLPMDIGMSRSRAWSGFPLTEKIAGAISSSLSGILTEAIQAGTICGKKEVL